MSPNDKPNESAAPEGAKYTPERPTSPASASHGVRPQSGGSLALALLLALIALIACAYVGWRQWQQERVEHVAKSTVGSLQSRVSALEATLAGVSGERTSLNQRLNDADEVNRSLREELLGQSARTRNLEDAVAKLAQSSLSGHDAMLLDETESLLRMADERYTLFHDAQGAAAAYTLADQTLAAVDDSAFAGLRQHIDAERDALAKSQPASQVATLQQLTELRGSLDTLPLKPLDGSGALPIQGTWARIERALASVFSVQHSNGAPLTVADARFARELVALDLAQAQAAVMAYDSNAYAEALQRVDLALSTQFDGSAAVTQRARATLKQLSLALPGGAAGVEVGAALAELRNMRATYAAGANTSSASPAHAGTVGGSKP